MSMPSSGFALHVVGSASVMVYRRATGCLGFAPTPSSSDTQPEEHGQPTASLLAATLCEKGVGVHSGGDCKRVKCRPFARCAHPFRGVAGSPVPTSSLSSP
jgi:hypothetical protein